MPDATTTPEIYTKPLPSSDLPPPDTLLTDDIIRQVIEATKVAGNNPEETPFAEISQPAKRAFLVGLSLCGRWGKATALAGLSHYTPYTKQWRGDTALQEAIKVAAEMAVQIAEDEAYRRAVEGVIEPTGWYKGDPGAYVRRYSDVLLIFWLKGAKPDKYKDRLEMRATLGNIDLNQLTQGQLARIAAGESPFAVLATGQPALGVGLDVTPAEPGATAEPTGEAP